MDLQFSIIIPYWNRAYELNLVLKALSLQEYDRNKFETIIIDDGSDGNIDHLLKKYSKELTITYQTNNHTGNRGKNRNMGAALARADRLIFLDSDMIPNQRMLTAFDKHTESEESLVSLGLRTLLIDFDTHFIDESVLEKNFELLDNLPSLKDERTMLLNFTKRSGLKWKGNWQSLYSHCFCLWKKKFTQTSGFDEQFSENWGAEDVELGYRLFRAGCRIVFNEKVRCYHLYHYTDIAKTVKSLKKNYYYFNRKYNDWQVELFTREFEYWPIQSILFQHQILAGKHLVTRLDNIPAVIKHLPANTILAGIDIPELINSEKVTKAFIPQGQSESGKIINIMGICLEEPPESYSLALVSSEYTKIDVGMYHYLCKRLSKLAGHVIPVSNNDKEIINKITNRSKHKVKFKRFLSFSLYSYVNHSYNRYYFLCMAIAAHKLGILTSVEIASDSSKEIELNKGFLYFSNPEKMNIINQLRSRQFNFIGDLVPCFMDAEASVSNNRSLGQRIFWQELRFVNQDKYFIKNRIRTYSRFFFKRDWEIKLFPRELEKHFLPVGIDRKKIERIRKENQRTDKTFTFLWAEKLTRPYTNLKMVLKAFKNTFGYTRDIIMKVLVPSNYRIYIRNEFYGDSFNEMSRNSVYYFKNSFARYLEEVLAEFGGQSNIKFIYKNDSDEECSRQLFHCDCFVSINSRLDIHPLVLESIAFGKKPIIPDCNCYAGYLQDEWIRKVKTKKLSAVYELGFLESPKIENIERPRYYLIYQPDMNSLCEKMAEAVSDGTDMQIDSKVIREFTEKFDWLTIAEQMSSLLF